MIHHALGRVGAFYGAFVRDYYGRYDLGLITLLLLSVVALALSMLLPELLDARRQ